MWKAGATGNPLPHLWYGTRVFCVRSPVHLRPLPDSCLALVCSSVCGCFSCACPPCGYLVRTTSYPVPLERSVPAWEGVLTDLRQSEIQTLVDDILCMPGDVLRSDGHVVRLFLVSRGQRCWLLRPQLPAGPHRNFALPLPRHPCTLPCPTTLFSPRVRCTALQFVVVLNEDGSPLCRRCCSSVPPQPSPIFPSFLQLRGSAAAK